MKKNPTDKEIMELAEKMFYEAGPMDGLTWDNCPYMLAKGFINDAANILGWIPNQGKDDE